MPRLVVADASPLIGMAAAGAFDLLRELFGTVTITRLVKDEVTGARRSARCARAGLGDARGLGPRRSCAARDVAVREIDAGEASTIALATQREGALVLMDDALGREQAAAVGLEVLDLSGLLLAAKRARLIDAVQPLVVRLARRGFTMPEDVRRTLLREAGEH